MPCYHPLTAYQRLSLGKGYGPVVFNPDEFNRQGFNYRDLTLPCSKCFGCYSTLVGSWASRCLHEASLYSDNCFLTLTFNDESLLQHCPDGYLNKTLFPKFLKDLRNRFYPGIRFFHCGEYGSKRGRPHHHALLFNFNFPDRVPFARRGKHVVCSSELLSKLWPYGFSEIGTVTSDSAAYIARYCTKKRMKVYSKESSSDSSDEDVLYAVLVDPVSSKSVPEYLTMSTNPGIGHGWFQKFWSDVYPHGFLVLPSGKKVLPPRYYDKLFALRDPDAFDTMKVDREERVHGSEFDFTPERLFVREQVALARFRDLERSFENDN